MYANDLNADDAEFGYLQESQQVTDTLMSNEDKEGGAEPLEYVTHEEIERRVRRVARGKEVRHGAIS